MRQECRKVNGAVRILGRPCARFPGCAICGTLEPYPQRKQSPLITLQQDAEGFVRMDRHYPASVRIAINFNDGSTGEFSGLTLNNAYDAALAEFRAKNNLDARGFNRTRAGRANPGNKVDFVPVHPGMGE